MKTINFSSIAEKHNVQVVETTTGQALVGFDNMEQAEQLAHTYDLDMVLLKQRDGAQLWTEAGTYCSDKALDRREDYSDNDNCFILDSKEAAASYRDFMIDAANEEDDQSATDMQNNVEAINKTFDVISKAIDDDHFVVVADDPKDYEVIDRYSMMYHDNDVTAYAIALAEY